MQIKAEENITEYKKSLEKDIEKYTISLCAVMLSKLNYKKYSSEKIEEKLLKFNTKLMNHYKLISNLYRIPPKWS